jgi:hypothetical protein
MNLPRTIPTLALLAWSLAVSAATARGDVTYAVTVDTSSLPTGTQGYLDFQFNAGGSEAQPSTAIIDDFQAIGIDFGTLTTYGAASATAAIPGGALALANTFADNEAIQAVTFATGSALSFEVTLGGPAVDAPDGRSTTGTSFYFGILDLTYNPLLPTLGPVDPLVELDVIAITGVIVPFNDAPAVVTLTSPVPEPSSLGLTATGLAIVTMAARRRRGQCGRGGSAMTP